MSQRCRAQWIKVILICLQKQFQLKDFGVGDAKWGILRHHKTQGHDEIIKTAVSMEKGCEYIRTKRNWQKSQTHNWELQNPFLWKERKHVRGWTVLSAESVEAACNGSINTGGGSGRRVLAQRCRLGSSRTGNSWGQSSAQTELLYIFLGRQLGNWLYTC